MIPAIRLDIGRKMLLGYLPLAVIITLTALTALVSLERLRRVNTGIVQVDVPLIEASTALTDELLGQELYGRRYLILKAPEMLAEFWKRSEAVHRLLERVRALDPAPDGAVAQLTALHEEYNRLFILDTRMPDGPSERVGEHSEISRLRHKEMVELSGRLSSRLRARLQEKNARAAAFGGFAYRLTGVLSVFGILLGFGSAALITRNISRSIRRLKAATDQVAEGRFDDLPVVRSRDELGDLSLAFGKMAQHLKELEELSLDANPLTRLPGGSAIHRGLDARLAAGEPFAFCLVDLDNFKAYNDRYGYARGSDLILRMAHLLRDVLGSLGTPEDFLGHVGGDDFVILTSPDRFEPLCREIVRAFDAMIPSVYSEDDRRRGFIVGKTRQGQTVKFPIMSVTVAVVTSDRNGLDSHVRVGEVAAELKEFAKAQPGSKYVVDRRSGDGGGEGRASAGAENA